MLESSIAAFPWPVLYQSVLGHGAPVDGNRDARRAPHDVYRCEGGYEWVAVAVENDGQFAALAGAIGRPELARDPRFATLAARRLNADELDAVLSAWTAGQAAAAVADHLRAAGVPAERVHHIDDLFRSASLLEREFFLELDHPAVGRKRLAGVPWRTSRSPMVAATAAPCLGQHTDEVLARWLGVPSPSP